MMELELKHDVNCCIICFTCTMPTICLIKCLDEEKLSNQHDIMKSPCMYKFMPITCLMKCSYECSMMLVKSSSKSCYVSFHDTLSLAMNSQTSDILMTLEKSHDLMTQSVVRYQQYSISHENSVTQSMLSSVQ